MARVTVGDIGMHYVEAGEGDPVILIMGFGGDHQAWGFQLPALAGSHRVIAFDNRGAGQTDAPDAPYSTRQMAADTAGLMDALGIERAHVIGVSMGGMIGQELAIAFPARVRSLQLHCTYARPDNYLRALVAAWRTARLALDDAAALRTLAPWLFASATYNERPEFVEMILEQAAANPYRQTRVGFLRQSEAVEHHDALDRVAAIRCPTLVSAAAEDILVPPRFARALAERIPGAELRVLPAGGHVYFWEHPEGFNDLCLKFLSRVS
jgi:pimeloyl-ACP methyl ester carboxylesterase